MSDIIPTTRDRAARSQRRRGPRRKARLHRPAAQADLRRLAGADAPFRPPARRLGVRREERIAMMMLDTIDCRSYSSARSAPASCRSRSTRCCRISTLHAGGFPRAGAVGLGRPVPGARGHRRSHAGPGACRHRPGPARPRYEGLRRRARRRERRLRDRPRMRTNRPSGCIRPARPACPRACGMCMPVSLRPRRPMPNRCSASARTTSACRRRNCFSPTVSAMR